MAPELAYQTLEANSRRYPNELCKLDLDLEAVLESQAKAIDVHYRHGKPTTLGCRQVTEALGDRGHTRE